MQGTVAWEEWSCYGILYGPSVSYPIPISLLEVTYEVKVNLIALNGLIVDSRNRRTADPIITPSFAIEAS